MKKLTIPIIFFVCAGINVNAQEKTAKEKKGDNFYFVYSYNKAIEAYTGSKELTLDGQRKLAKSYHKIGSNELAEKQYEKLIYATSGKNPEDYFDYAMVLKSSAKYDESNKQMDRFKVQKPEDLRAIDYTENKDKLNTLLTDNGRFKVNNSKVNTDAQDFGPSYYKDKIVFASSRSTKMMPKRSNINDLPFLNIYVSELSNGVMQTPANFDKSMNENMNEGPASFNKEGTFMAFTQNNYDLTKKELVVKLEIFFKTFKDDKWSKSEPFALNNNNYSVGHANLSADGNTMYFASDMPGGFGGSDIYKVTKEGNGKWSTAENLGTKINTEGDELYPFFEEKSGTFFFTSNGRFGLGGFDVFTNKTNASGFQTSVNAGTPLNTQYDDFGAIADDQMSKGYFSSNRPGGSGNDDIFTLEISEPIKKTEEIVKAPIEEPVAVVEPVKETPIQKETVKETTQTKTDRIFEKKIKVGDDLSEVLEFKNIYFDLDKSNIRPDAINSLNNIVSMMNIHQNMVVELKAHTDCRETMTYNQLLSDRRAKSTIKYIKSRISDPSRISGKGYGKSRLINRCNCDGQKSSDCTEASHQKNRRTEFIIIKN